MASVRSQLFVLCFVAVFAIDKASPQIAPHDSPPTVERIAAHLGEMNARRKAALTSYESRRIMTVTYLGALSQGEAAETVVMTFRAPATKEFTVLSASGSQLIRDSVFQRALNAEQTAAGDAAQRASALNLENYSMVFIGREQLPTCNCLVLSVVPKLASEFTYAGRVWVDPVDYAVVRIQGRPAMNPSPWITEGQFTTDFEKVGDFYFPQQTVSNSNLPLGMRAQLTIQYSSYRILAANSLHK